MEDTGIKSYLNGKTALSTGLVITLLAFYGNYMATATNVGTLQQQYTQVAQASGSIQVEESDLANRVTRLEANYVAIEADLHDIKDSIKQIQTDLKPK